MHRIASPFALLLLTACGGPGGQEPAPQSTPNIEPKLTTGEERTRIAAKGQTPATLRSGPRVPVVLPRGFTLYPGAEVVSNTVVERGAMRPMLLVFRTPASIEQVMLYYRAQARAAGMTVEVDLAGRGRASLGGTLRSGGAVAIVARREERMTRVEFAQS